MEADALDSEVVVVALEATAESGGGSSSSPTEATDVDALYSEAMRDADDSSPGWVSTVAVVRIDNNWIRCSVCSQNLLYLNSPVVFQCNNGHLACQICRAGRCTKCRDSAAGFDAWNTVAEHFVLDSKFKCPHRGCHGFFSYREVTAHNDACPQAPCSCGCGFAGPPHPLLRHLVSQHSWPAYPTRYGKVLSLRVPASGPCRRLILSMDDARVFALVVGKLHESTAVSLVCVRAGASPSPSYKAQLRANVDPWPSSVVAGSKSTVAMEVVTSSSMPGEVVLENLPCVLPVPRMHEITGDEEVFLKILVVIFRKDQ